MHRVLNVAEKNDAAKSLARLLSKNGASMREGFSRYNKIYEFNYQLFNQPVQMIFTSVSGHIMNCDFTAAHNSWAGVDPVVLFDAKVQKKVTDRATDIEEEEEEEEGGRENYQDNEDFKGAALIELVDEELNGWVHHAQYVLPQGRTKWWNPTENIEKDEEDEDEDEEEMKAEAEEIEPEQGPPLLTPIGADAEIESTKAWTAKISSNLIPQYACAIIRSNLWPGAYAFARGMAWENIYIGFGHKYVTTDYGPELPPLPANEYNDGPEIAEADDPLPEDEAKAKAAEEQAAGEEEEEEEEEENEEEEDDN
ncbi:unnamed protein product [Adineta steineri]|uniref:DNA topoisomerase n=1 Tax=Adineta steineri TaxID=433720 RepID=A0A815AX64_9BILA|nr:unnamed protein product [Adineta steineri]